MDNFKTESTPGQPMEDSPLKEINSIVTDRILDFYIAKLKKVGEFQSVEHKHLDADNVLCELLNDLGFGRVVEVYNKIEKWYQ